MPFLRSLMSMAVRVGTNRPHRLSYENAQYRTFDDGNLTYK